jgi:RNA polymerase sigma factor (sigma-70 family)
MTAEATPPEDVTAMERGQPQGEIDPGHIVARYDEEITRLYDREVDRLITYLRGSDRDRSLPDAQDIAQEAFLITRTRWEHVRGYRNPAAFVFRTAHLLQMNHFRSSQRTATNFLEQDLPHPTAGVEYEVAIDLRNALARLPERQRQVILLRVYLGYDTEETAEILSISSGTVKSTKSDSLKNLREIMDETRSSRNTKKGQQP